MLDLQLPIRRNYLLNRKTVKTILQLETAITPQQRIYAWNKYIKDGGYFECYRKIKLMEGRLGLWKGFSSTLIRAFYANAIGFYFYETSKEMIVQKFKPSKSE